MSSIVFATELLADRMIGQLTEVPAAVTGTWIKDGHKFSITEQDLADIVENFEKRGNGEIVVDFEHASEKPEVARGGPVPAAGWVKSLSIRKREDGEGSELWADVQFTKDARALIKEGKYRYFSPALDWGAADKRTGRAKGATMTSGALTNHPFLEELPAIQLSEKAGRILDKVVVPVPDRGKVKIKIDTKKGEKDELADTSLDQKRAAVGAAIQEAYGPPMGSAICSPKDSICVKDIFDDYAIAETGGKLYRFDYAMDDQGNVNLEAPVQVAIEYVEATDVKRAKLTADQKRNAISREIAKGYGEVLGAFPSIKKMAEDHVIAEHNGKRYRLGYRIDSRGKVKLTKPQEEKMQFDDNRQHEKYEVGRKPSDSDEDQFHVDGGHNPDRGGRNEAEKRARQIDEPSSGDGTDVLEASDKANLPKLGLRRMKSGDRHHAIVDLSSGKIHGFVSHEDIKKAASGKASGDEWDGEKDGEKDKHDKATKEVLRRTNDLMRKDRRMTYREAHESVLASDADLKERYNAEHNRVLL